jgi:hypothetical protein
MYFLACVFLNLTLFMTKRWVLVLRFHYFMDGSVVRGSVMSI